MFALLLLLLLAVPIAELYVILQVGDRLGWLPTIALLIGISVAGAWLLHRQGVAAWNRLRETVAAGRMPTRELADGALILLGGALLLTPGFLTDVVGLCLLIPPTRSAIRGTFARAAVRWGRRRGGRSRVYYETTVIRSERVGEDGGASSRPLPTGESRAETSPSEQRPDGGDDSPDRA